MQDNKESRKADKIELLLRSSSPEEFSLGLNEAQEWLLENPDESQIVNILVSVSEQTEFIARREQIIALLSTLKGSSSTKQLQRKEQSTKDENQEKLREKSLEAYYEGQFDLAIEMFKSYLHQHPDDLEIISQLEKARLRQLGTDNASGLQRSHTKTPKHAWQLYRRARSYLAAGDVKSAQKLLIEAVDIAERENVNFPEALGYLDELETKLTALEYKKQGEAQLLAKNWEKALEIYQYAYQLDPEDSHVTGVCRALEDLLRAQSLLSTLQIEPISATNIVEQLTDLQQTILAAIEIRVLAPLAQDVAKALHPFRREVAEKQKEQGYKLALQGDDALTLDQKELFYQKALRAFHIAWDIGGLESESSTVELIESKLNAIKRIHQERLEQDDSFASNKSINLLDNMAWKDFERHHALSLLTSAQQAIDVCNRSLESNKENGHLQEICKFLQALQDVEKNIIRLSVEQKDYCTLVNHYLEQLDKLRGHYSIATFDTRFVNQLLNKLVKELSKKSAAKLESIKRKKTLADSEQKSIENKCALYTQCLEDLINFINCPIKLEYECDSLLLELKNLKSITCQGKEAIDKYRASEERPEAGTLDEWLLYARQDQLLLTIQKVIACERDARTLIIDKKYYEAVDLLLSESGKTSDKLLESYAELLLELVNANNNLDRIAEKDNLNEKDYVSLLHIKSILAKLDGTLLAKNYLVTEIRAKLRPLSKNLQEYTKASITKQLNEYQNGVDALEYCRQLIIAEENTSRKEEFKELRACIQSLLDAKYLINQLNFLNLPMLAFRKRRQAKELVRDSYRCDYLKNTAFYKETKRELDLVPLVNDKLVKSLRLLFFILFVSSLIGMIIPEVFFPNITPIAGRSTFANASTKSQNIPTVVGALAVEYEAPTFTAPNQNEYLTVRITNNSLSPITVTLGYIASPTVYPDINAQMFENLSLEASTSETVNYDFRLDRAANSNRELMLDIIVKNIETADGIVDNNEYVFEGPIIPIRRVAWKRLHEIGSSLANSTLLEGTATGSFVILIFSLLFGIKSSIKD